MNTAEAMTIRKGEVVKVRGYHKKATWRALVLDSPWLVEMKDGTERVLISVAYASRSFGSDVDTFSRVAHTMTVGGPFPDEVSR